VKVSSSVSWLDSLYVSCPVFSQMRKDYGQEADGVIFGFPQDIHGAVLQFPQGDKVVRFFITFEELQIAWRSDGVYRINQANVKLVGVFPNKNLVLGKGNSSTFVRVNRYRVPLYTCYV
jgi:hypothetical protein